MPMQATTTTPLFSAQLTPNRRLGARGMGAAGSLVALLVALPGLVLAGIDILLIGVAMVLTVLGLAITLYISTRQGKRREQVTVWAEQLEWSATDADGAQTLRRFDPKTVRLVLDRDGDEKTQKLRLRAGSVELEIGTFLNSDDKSSFAKALGTALRRARAV